MNAGSHLAKASKAFLKWPGGKRWIAPLLAGLIRESLSGRYFEPFCGSGSVFFELGHSPSVLSDINSELIAAFRALRSKPEAVLRGLHRLSNSAECYYRVRRSIPRTKVGRAVRFIYLNRTCWGGIYRLNQNGKFNVPFGNSGRIICRSDILISAACALRAAKLVVSDFERVIELAREGDVVYADPPYTTLGENNGFLRYNERLFAWTDQIRLAKVCREAERRSATMIISGLCHASLLSLYKGWWVIRVPRYSTVSRLASGHRHVTEVLITNRQPPRSVVEQLGDVRLIGTRGSTVVSKES